MSNLVSNFIARRQNTDNNTIVHVTRGKIHGQWEDKRADLLVRSGEEPDEAALKVTAFFGRQSIVYVSAAEHHEMDVRPSKSNLLVSTAAGEVAIKLGAEPDCDAGYFSPEHLGLRAIRDVHAAQSDQGVEIRLQDNASNYATVYVGANGSLVMDPSANPPC